MQCSDNPDKSEQCKGIRCEASASSTNAMQNNVLRPSSINPTKPTTQRTWSSDNVRTGNPCHQVPCTKAGLDRGGKREEGRRREKRDRGSQQGKARQGAEYVQRGARAAACPSGLSDQRSKFVGPARRRSAPASTTVRLPVERLLGPPVVAHRLHVQAPLSLPGLLLDVPGRYPVVKHRLPRLWSHPLHPLDPRLYCSVWFLPDPAPPQQRAHHLQLSCA